jgi:hypothetical protein
MYLRDTFRLKKKKIENNEFESCVNIWFSNYTVKTVLEIMAMIVR